MIPTTARSGSTLQFIRGFLRDPRGVASVWPSSRFLAQRIVEAGRVGSVRSVVELGPGTGAITRGILGGMPATGRLLAIEVDAGFAAHLRDSIPDPRLTVYHGRSSELDRALSAADLTEVDLVVSGIPFSQLEEPAARRTLSRVYAVLRPGGRFVAYQVRDAVVRRARPIFGEPRLDGELLNVPPMRIYTWCR